MLNIIERKKSHPVPKGNAIAVVTIRDADKMTVRGRKRIAAWLHAQADLITAEGSNYAPRFRGRYLCSDRGA